LRPGLSPEARGYDLRSGVRSRLNPAAGLEKFQQRATIPLNEESIRGIVMLSEKLLSIAFTRAVRRGTLEMTTAGGQRMTFGNGQSPKVAIRFTDAAAQMALCLHPELKLGELFMDGRL